MESKVPTGPQPFAYEVRGRCVLSGPPALLSGIHPQALADGGRREEDTHTITSQEV